MPLPQKYTLTASESFVRDEDSGAEWKFAAGEGALVDFAVYELSPNALFPLPHYWRILAGARSAASKSASARQAPDLLRAACEAEIEQSSGAKRFFARLFSSAAQKLLTEPSLRSVLVPKQQVYPAIFEIKFDTSGGSLFAKVEKIM